MIIYDSISLVVIVIICCKVVSVIKCRNKRVTYLIMLLITQDIFHLTNTTFMYLANTNRMEWSGSIVLVTQELYHHYDYYWPSLINLLMFNSWGSYYLKLKHKA